MSAILSPIAQAAASEPTFIVNGARADIAINRPDVYNRIQPEDIAALHRHFDAIDVDESIRVVVISGNGRSFSSGFHLGELSQSGEGARLFERLTQRLEDLRPVTVARVNGPVYGGATDLAIACDFRIGVANTQMFMPASRLGLHFYPTGLRRWATRLGPNAAKKLFLTSATIHGPEMLRIGYLDELVEADQLDAATDALVEKLLAQAPLPIVGMKRILNQIFRGEFDESAGRDNFEGSLGSSDILEGVTAWHEKRKPVFNGR